MGNKYSDISKITKKVDLDFDITNPPDPFLQHLTKSYSFVLNHSPVLSEVKRYSNNVP